MILSIVGGDMQSDTAATASCAAYPHIPAVLFRKSSYYACRQRRSKRHLRGLPSFFVASLPPTAVGPMGRMLLCSLQSLPRASSESQVTMDAGDGNASLLLLHGSSHTTDSQVSPAASPFAQRWTRPFSRNTLVATESTTGRRTGCRRRGAMIPWHTSLSLHSLPVEHVDSFERRGALC